AATIASRTLSETPSFFSFTSESVLRSKLVAVDLILAMTTGSGSPALIICTTASLVSTSWASEVVPGSERPTAATRASTSTTRIIFDPSWATFTVETRRDHPGGRGDRATNLGYFVNPVNMSRTCAPGQGPRRGQHGQERGHPVDRHGRRDPDPAGEEADPEGAGRLGADAGREDAHGPTAAGLRRREQHQRALHGGEAGLAGPDGHQHRQAGPGPAQGGEGQQEERRHQHRQGEEPAVGQEAAARGDGQRAQQRTQPVGGDG